MKIKILLTILAYFFTTSTLLSIDFTWNENKRPQTYLEKLFNVGPGSKKDKLKKTENKNKKSSINFTWNENKRPQTYLEKLFNIAPGSDNDQSKKSNRIENTNIKKTSADNLNITAYTGEFDILDKEGDDNTGLFGIEHKNSNLFRNTFLGKFSPVTGGFITGKNSVYVYTGVEGQYNLGPINIRPSFAPGYYEKGSGKDLGDVMEFKSEIRLGFDLFKNSSLGYSYSHISNNDWGKKNPGTDNQSISFLKKF